MKPVALFAEYTCTEDYEKAGLKFISPMLAKELEEEDKQDACLNSADYYVEEEREGECVGEYCIGFACVAIAE